MLELLTVGKWLVWDRLKLKYDSIDMYIHGKWYVYAKGGGVMATAMTSIRLDTHLADEAAQIPGMKSRTEVVLLRYVRSSP